MITNDTAFNKIAEALLIDYSSVYYVDAVTNEYIWYSINSDFHSLKLEQQGEDFFKNMARDAKQVVYEEDMHIFLEDIQKDKLLKNMKNNHMQSIEYRLMIDGKPVWHALRVIREISEDDDYFILGVLNVDKQVRERIEAKSNEMKSVTYGAIAETLASHYDIIYYVDIGNGEYAEFTTNNIYGNLEMSEEGKDFFSDAQRNAVYAVYPDDKDRVLEVLTKDYLLSALEDVKQYSTDYRLMIDDKPQYTRLTVMFSSDHIHFIIGVENITEEVKKEAAHLKALKSANELARRDELTGAKNKKAYHEMEEILQENMDNNIHYPFAIIVCDLNNLKMINDTLGHKAGDEYIKTSAKMIFDTFAHSPVFRVGGDEFVAVLTKRDYEDRKKLLEYLKNQVLANQKDGNKPVIAVGMSTYDFENDTKVSEIFNRADNLMYRNKKELKGE
ncbi:MAG: GGDEF domain-containing protein [Lachnospiraceae bacterium]|nr:GGDEF domain-containing protein [Lachnospiraceae bacterium]